MTDTVLAQYMARHRTLERIAERLQEHIAELLRERPLKVDRVSARAKAPLSFYTKSQKIKEDSTPKYVAPLRQIQDQVGARVTVLYLEDVETVGDYLQRYFTHVEKREIVPESVREFGYFGKHWVNILPIEVVPDDADEEQLPEFFELQVKTLFQHAWSEAEHDLGYKPDIQLTQDQIRYLAFTSAQAWGADRIFDDLRKALRTDQTPH